MRKMLWWREEYRDISTRFYYLIRVYTMKLAEHLVAEGVIGNASDIWFLKVGHLWDYLDGKVSAEGWGPTTPGDGPVTSLDRAIELIQRNTRRYAKRQLSYWGRDKEIKWLEM